MFGDLRDKMQSTRTPLPEARSIKTSGVRGKRNFTLMATAVTVNQNSTSSQTKKGLSSDKQAFHKPCIFCKDDHALEQCKKLQKLLHKDKLDFLRSKGLCFSCLKLVHMSKSCEEKLSCHLCYLLCCI